MLLVCPSCSSEYAIDPDRIGPAGRKVRCASCRETWFVSAEEVESAQAPEPDLVSIAEAPGPVIDEPPAIPRQSERRRRRQPAPLNWVRAFGAPALAACLVLAVPAALVGRRAVVAALPQTAEVFGAVGLPVNLVGLTLGDISSGISVEGTRRILVVEGVVTNPGAQDIAVPPLDLTVEGGSGETLYRWSARVPAASVAAGESQAFKVRLAAPPPEGRRVVVTFAGSSGGAAVASR
ncbi:MAG: zinc-ribbon domain-containing protein [Methylobacteriaceae bacterium]|nr:zinc-ribbon domain-containing protein [Methylobacteriaceae bacterium]